MFSGCTFKNNNYKDDKKLEEDKYSAKGYSADADEEQKGYHLKAEKMDGIREIAFADVQKDCNVEILFLNSVFGGKLKLCI